MLEQPSLYEDELQFFLIMSSHEERGLTDMQLAFEVRV